jgi:uncharacterized protein
LAAMGDLGLGALRIEEVPRPGAARRDRVADGLDEDARHLGIAAEAGRAAEGDRDESWPRLHPSGTLMIVDQWLREDLGRFRSALERHFGTDLIALVAFGSQVRGGARPESDLDLLLIVEGLPRRRMDRRRVLRPIVHGVSEPFAQTVSLILLTPLEAASVKPFYLGILEGHEILVDRGGAFRRILDRLTARLAELGSRRLTDEKGNPYWDLKPDYRLGEDIVL